MKKNILSLVLSLAALGANAQATETILLEANFSTGIHTSLNTNSSFNHSLSKGFDGQEGVGEITLDPFGYEYELTWNSMEELSPEIDSIEVSLKLGKNPNGYPITVSEQDNQVLITSTESHELTFSFTQTDYKAEVLAKTTGNFTASSTDPEYITVTNTYRTLDDRLSVVKLSQEPSIYTIETATKTYKGEIPFVVAQNFCRGEFPKEAKCPEEIEYQMPYGQLSSLFVDDIKITTYTTDPGMEDQLFYNNKEVFAVYNPDGQPSSFQTTNEVIIVKFTDGSTERVFNIR